MELTFNTFQPSGILDGTQADDFRERITEMIEQGSKIILIDFQKVTFMDSSGLGVLVLSWKRARAADVALYLCSINEQIAMLFELTSMDRVFEIFDNPQDFQEKVIQS